MKKLIFHTFLLTKIDFDLALILNIIFSLIFFVKNPNHMIVINFD